MAFFSNLFSDSNKSVLSRLQKTVDLINGLEKEFEAKSQEDLKGLTKKWKEALSSLDLDENQKIFGRNSSAGFCIGTGGGQTHAGPKTLRRPAFGRHGFAWRFNRRNENW